ncbi:MAG: CehA/McbA family metallohydrolase [Spirochaetales bacterium]|nr:CehA/McbA family metallohydrolase [Spirochaetales bacterium]
MQIINRTFFFLILTGILILSSCEVSYLDNDDEWISGDFHLHSDNSDDSDSDMAELISYAENAGFGFFVVADHDKHVIQEDGVLIDDRLETWDDEDYTSDSMIILYGTEWTACYGHANFFSAEPWDHLYLYQMKVEDRVIGWDPTYLSEGWHTTDGKSSAPFSLSSCVFEESEESDSSKDDEVASRTPSIDSSIMVRENKWLISYLVDEVHNLGLHFSVNHPYNDNPWEPNFYEDYDDMEVWNGLYLLGTQNVKALEKWDEILTSGRMLTGRGGSDCHHISSFESNFLLMGNPTTWVKTDGEETGEAVLEALKKGRVSISYDPEGERVDYTADADGDGSYETLPGDNLTDGIGSTINFKIALDRMVKNKIYFVRVIKNGEIFIRDSFTSRDGTYLFSDTPDARSYYRVEIRGSNPEGPDLSALLQGTMIAVSNPVYVGYDE